MLRNLRVRFGVLILFGEAKTDDVDLGAYFAHSDQEAIRLNISVDKELGVNILDPGDKLICNEQDSLQRESAVTVLEEILQARSKEVQNHHVVITFCAEPADPRNPDTSS